jgi:hypothetical protein
MLVKAKVIFRGSEFVGCFDEFVPLNCDLMSGSPKAAWLVRNPDTIRGNSIELKQPTNGSALAGTWVTIAGEGLLIDGSVADLVAACNACCGDEPEITPVYNGVFPDPLSPVVKDYTVARTDGGRLKDFMQMNLDYQPWAIPDSMYISSRNEGTGVTTYKFQAYEDPRPLTPESTVTDTITQTPLVFSSNAPGALTTGNQWHVEVYADGMRLGTGKNGTTNGALSTIDDLLNADPVFNVKGTYAFVTDHLTLSTTNTDFASIVVTQITP